MGSELLVGKVKWEPGEDWALHDLQQMSWLRPLPTNLGTGAQLILALYPCCHAYTFGMARRSCSGFYGRLVVTSCTGGWQWFVRQELLWVVWETSQ